MLVVDRLNFFDVGQDCFRTLKGKLSVPKLVPFARLVGGERFFFLGMRIAATNPSIPASRP
ncbi:hypothetical protein V5O39_04610 [Pseudomonas parakoreensis]